MKASFNNKDTLTKKKVNGMVLSSQANGIQFHHLHHHHATCQRHQKSKFIATPVVNESMYLLFCSIEI